MELNVHILNRLARSAEARSTANLSSKNLSVAEIIEWRSQGGDRRTQQRRSHADDRRSSGRAYLFPHLLPRRVRGERRQREGMRATD